MTIPFPAELAAEQTVPLEKRKLGPAFEKPCRNRATIICVAEKCRIAYACQWRGETDSTGQPLPAYGSIWYENL